MVLSLVLLAVAVAAVAGLLVLQLGLIRVFSSAPRLAAREPAAGAFPTSLSVVIPAYNEAANIAACLTSVMASLPPCSDWQVMVVDDGSTDATAALAMEAAATSPAAARFSLLQAGPRPAGERWVGKNWACTRASEALASEWLLFVDADVRLQPDAIERALAQAIADQADLLSLAPRLGCACLAEWMVQPIMASLLGLGFPIEAANDPADPTAFAAGPFMLFRRLSYERIGGHRALAAEVVEDLALARRIKQSGLRLSYRLGLDAVDLQMYPNLAALWEGWTKNWFLGLDADVVKALAASSAVVVMFSGPWLVAPAAALLLWLAPEQRALYGAALLLSLIGVAEQALLRLWSRREFQVPMHWWWLMGLGGLLVGAIGPASTWRSLTGLGWTWKGRPLA